MAQEIHDRLSEPSSTECRDFDIADEIEWACTRFQDAMRDETTAYESLESLFKKRREDAVESVRNAQSHLQFVGEEERRLRKKLGVRPKDDIKISERSGQQVGSTTKPPGSQHAIDSSGLNKNLPIGIKSSQSTVSPLHAHMESSKNGLNANRRSLKETEEKIATLVQLIAKYEKLQDPTPQMWGYYYPQPHYDTNASSYYWEPHMPPPHMAPPPQNPQQTPLMTQPSNLSTSGQIPMAMPTSPRVPPIGVQQSAPQTPQSPHPSLPAGTRSSFIAKQPILIKNSAGEMIDLADLSKRIPPKQEDASAVPSVKKEEMERRPVWIRFETADAHKKQIEEEKLKDKNRFKKDELAKLKVKRNAEAKERAKRDQEEKERRQREQEEANQKKLDEERAKREAEKAEKERIKSEEEGKREKECLQTREEEAAAEHARGEAEEEEKARLAESMRHVSSLAGYLYNANTPAISGARQPGSDVPSIGDVSLLKQRLKQEKGMLSFYGNAIRQAEMEMATYRRFIAAETAEVTSLPVNL